MQEIKKTLLSEPVQQAIDAWMTRYPPDQKRSAVLQALMFAQEANHGYLTIALMDAVADYLDLPHVAVYEVVSFYTLYNTKPVGKHIINICTNLSCQLNDAEKILHHVEKRLGIHLNQTTPDGKFTLREVECLAACINAPVAQIGKKYHENLTTEKIDAILKELE